MAILRDPVAEWVIYLQRFDLPVYDENTVPEDGSLPRITFSWAEGEFETPVSLTISLWYRDQGWRNISEKADAIYEDVGLAGVLLAIAGGHLWVKRGSPFSQRMSDTSPDIRRVIINFDVEFLRG